MSDRIYINASIPLTDASNAIAALSEMDRYFNGILSDTMAKNRLDEYFEGLDLTEAATVLVNFDVEPEENGSYCLTIACEEQDSDYINPILQYFASKVKELNGKVLQFSDRYGEGGRVITSNEVKTYYTVDMVNTFLSSDNNRITRALPRQDNTVKVTKKWNDFYTMLGHGDYAEADIDRLNTVLGEEFTRDIPHLYDVFWGVRCVRIIDLLGEKSLDEKDDTSYELIYEGPVNDTALAKKIIDYLVSFD